MGKLKIGSLFSGYGGLDMAVSEFYDAEVAWHCEWESAPSAILEGNSARYGQIIGTFLKLIGRVLSRWIF